MDSYHLAVAVIWIALFLLVAGPVHECAHALAASQMGDFTAKRFGRITLDPFVHFDPVGGGLLALSVVLGGVGFGWAKPTPVNPYNLRGRHADSIVAAAGPLSNLALAALFAIPFRILLANGIYWNNTSVPEMLQLVCYEGIWLNVVLMLFNLIPIAPLDGSHVLLDFLDPRTAQDVRQLMNQYGLFVLIAVILLAGRVISPVADPIVSLLTGLPVGVV